MWPDNETAKDLIGFKVHADLIRTVVANRKMLPLTVGVFGDWGGGKTSIMKMLERDLNPEQWPEDSEERERCERALVIYFNTWLFEGYDDAKSAILNAILQQIGQHKRFGPKARDGIVSLIKSVKWMRIAKIGFKHLALPAAAAVLTGGATSPALFSSISGIANSMKGMSEGKDAEETTGKDNAGDIIEKQPADDDVDIRTFRDRFNKLLVDSDIEYLVVLIDDLDRCTPDRIIDNLEAIKLFLAVDRTAFVIGADRRIIQHAIRMRYGTDNGLEMEGLMKDYVEKFIQVPYTIPRLSASEIQTYITLLFCQHYLDESQAERCLRVCEAERAKNRYGTFGYGGVREALGDCEIKGELSEALTLCVSTAPLIADGLKGNPRQVKRFLNALLLRKELARLANLKNIKDDVLTKLMILEYTHEDNFNQLFFWQSQQDGYPKEIAALEKSIAPPNGNLDDEKSAKDIDPKWATTSMRKWVAMVPLLANVDLRDYFWVARDRLQTTFSGISMVSPVVRVVIDGLLSDTVPKRNTAIETAKTLKSDEIASLLDLLTQHISRHPEDKKGYDSLRFLGDRANLKSAIDSLAQVLLTGAPDKMPPAVGMDVLTLMQTKPAFKNILQPAITRLSQTVTRIGRAVAPKGKGKGK